MALPSAPEATFLNLEYFFYKLVNFFARIFGFGKKGVDQNGYDVNTSPVSFDSSSYDWNSGGDGVNWFTILLIFLIIVALSVAFSSYLESKRESKKIQDKLRENVEKFVKEDEERVQVPAKSDSRVSKVRDLIASPEESNWKLAIFEADIILDNLTKEIGLVGDTLGERLMSADRARFKTLQNAWDAHKFRNMIAHGGDTGTLTYGMAKEAMRNYEAVFREFGYLNE